MKRILENLPSGWSEKQLRGHSVFLRRGKSPQYCDENQGLVVINQDCIRWDFMDLSKVKFHIVPNKIDEDFYLKYGDILINSTGTGTIGRVNQWAHQDTQAVADSHVTILRVKKESIYPKYARYFLSSALGQRYLESVCYTGSTNQIELSKRYLSRLYLPCAPLTEQKAIAEIISRVDKAIEVVEVSINAAERLKKSLMQNLLTGKLKPDGAWRSENEFIETRIGFLPKEWRLIKAKDLCLKVTDGTHDTPSPSQEGYPLVTSKNLKSSGVDFDGCYLVCRADYVEINKRSKVEQYDILFGMIGTVGNPQVVTQSPVEFAIKNVGLFKTNGDKELSFWIKNYLSSNMFEMYKYKQQAGTTQQFVSLGFLRKIPIPLPYKNDEIDYKQVREINKKITGITGFLSEKEKKRDSLKTLKKSLMQNLFTGKVRVNIEKINKLLEVE